MRMVSISFLLLVSSGAAAWGQEVQPPAGPPRALLTLQLRGAQRSFSDSV